jgi:hypothetical protein
MRSIFSGCRTRIVATVGPALLSYASPAFAVEDDAAQVEAIRTATERLKAVNVALEEGCIPDPAGHCFTAEMEGQPAEHGNMGIHCFRPDLPGITTVTPRVNGTGIYTDFQNRTDG